MAVPVSDDGYVDWNVVRTVTLGAPAADVWEVIGGFFTIHMWHPDITETAISPDQTTTRQVRRLLTFPGQPQATEELVSMDNADFHYTYKWHAGDWGEHVKNYHSSLRVFDGDLANTCVVQWHAWFSYPSDAISDFYQHGFAALLERFPLHESENA